MTPTVPDRAVPANWLDASALTDPTRCPACAKPLAGHRCPFCALDVSGPAGRELWGLSREAARVLTRRSEVIAAMRVQAAAPMSAPRSAPLPIAPPVTETAGAPRFARPGPPATPPALTRSAAAGPGQSVPATGASPSAAAGHARAVPPYPAYPVHPRQSPQPAPSWGLQTILQVVGAILLAAAGLVFTVFAWGHLSLGTRGAILVAITAAVFVGAWRAARANLRSAPEVIAALGSALVVLDAWVLWTAAGGGNGGMTFAGALLVSAVVLVPLGRVLKLTTASVVGLICLTGAPAVLAITISSVQGAAYLLALSVALCLSSRWLIGPPAFGASSPTTPGPVSPSRARAVVAGLSPFYLAGGALAVLSALVQDGPGHTVGPLLAITVVSALWAAAESGVANRAWSGVAGCALVLATTAGAASFTDLWTAGAQHLTVAWLLPLGAVIGFAVAVLVVPAVPRVGSTAVRAGWTTALAIGLVPAVWAAVLLINVMLAPGLVHDAEFRVRVLHVLLGLAVLIVARPVIHLLGGRVPRSQAPGHPVHALVDHPASASVVALVFIVLSLALTMPEPSWTIAALLVLATLIALARSPLTSWVPVRVPAALSTSSTPPPPPPPTPTLPPTLLPAGSFGSSTGTAVSRGTPMVPAPAWEEQVALRLGALVRGSYYSFCVLAVAVAAILSLVLAAGGDAGTSRTLGQGLVAATFLTAGLLLWIARGWIPTTDVRARSNRAALTFTSFVIASIGLGILARLAIPRDDIGWYAAPLPLVIALIVLGMRGDRAPGNAGDARMLPDHLATLGAAVTLCVPAFFVSAVTALDGIGSVAAIDADPRQALPVAVLAAVLLALTVALTWQLSFSSAARSGRDLRGAAGALVPFTGVLTLLSLRTIALAAHLDASRIDWLLAVLGLLAVIITWIGAKTSGPARLGAETAVATLAVITTVAVAAQGDPSRTSGALSIAAVGALAYGVASAQARWGWLALGLGVCASWVSLAGSGVPPETYTAPGALVVVGTGVWQLWRSGRPSAATDRSPHAIRLILAGLAVLVLPTVLLAPSDAAQSRAVVVTVMILWFGGTAWLLTFTRSAALLRDLVTGMTLLALGAAIIGLGGHAVGTAARTVARSQSSTPVTATSEAATGLTTGLWTAAAVLLTAGLAVLLTHVEVRSPAAVGHQVKAHGAYPRVWVPTVCAALATTPAAVLVAGGWLTSATDWVAGTLVVVWGITALLGTPPGLPRVQDSREFGLRAVPALAGAYVLALIGAAATSARGAEGGSGSLVDLLVLAGVFVALVGVRAAQVAPTSSSWSTVVYGALATIVPLTLDMIAEPSGGRIAVATVTAAAWLVLGVRMRWQAPVACGMLALLLQAVVLAGPPALAAMSGMLGWIALAGVGGVLLALGLTYEKQIATARKVLRRYSELR